MKNQYNITIILGTGRKERQSEKVARSIYERAKKNFEQSFNILDVRDFPTSFTVPPWQENQDGKELRALLKKADGYLVIIPEYNHGYPGELKLLFDRAKDEFQNKPIAFCGVSSGSFGGSRSVEQFIPITAYFGMISIIPVLYFSNIGNAFNNDGSLADHSFEKRIDRTLTALIKKIK